jgi:hypothetical protein
VGIHDDAALSGLSEDLSEANDRRHVRIDDVGEDLARAHRRKLIDVADDDQRSDQARARVRRACISNTSTIDVSSTIEQIAVNGIDSELRKLPAAGSTSRRR